MVGKIAQGDQAADPGFRGRHQHVAGFANGAQIDNDIGLIRTLFDLL